LAATARFCPACGRQVEGDHRGRSSLKNHVLILTVLVAAGGIFLAAQMISPEADARPELTPAETALMGGQKPTMDMDAFIASLPKDFESLVSMGNALMDQGHYAMAVECYTRALDQHPDDANVIVDLGACQHALGKNQEAVASFMKGLSIDPAHKIAKYNLGIVYWGLGDTAQARGWWEMFVKESPPSEMRSQVESLLAQLNHTH
jgi:tetratricopeptide (TPR) repeat protein